MRTVKCFVASSDELRMERLEVTDMFQQLNRILKPRNIQLEPVKWEYLDASMGPKHKQEEYNEELKTCEMPYTMIRFKIYRDGSQMFANNKINN